MTRKTRWNIREVFNRNTDTLGLVLGFTLVAVLTVFLTTIIIIKYVS